MSNLPDGVTPGDVDRSLGDGVCHRCGLPATWRCRGCDGELCDDCHDQEVMYDGVCPLCFPRVPNLWRIPMNDAKVIQSYVWHRQDKCFFVSTIIRDSSAEVDPPLRCTETVVWEWDCNTKKRKTILGVYPGSTTTTTSAFDHHAMVCRALYETGEYNE